MGISPELSPESLPHCISHCLFQQFYPHCLFSAILPLSLTSINTYKRQLSNLSHHFRVFYAQTYISYSLCDAFTWISYGTSTFTTVMLDSSFRIYCYSSDHISANDPAIYPVFYARLWPSSFPPQVVGSPVDSISYNVSWILIFLPTIMIIISHLLRNSFFDYSMESRLSMHIPNRNLTFSSSNLSSSVAITCVIMNVFFSLLVHKLCKHRSYAFFTHNCILSSSPAPTTSICWMSELMNEPYRKFFLLVFAYHWIIAVV